MNKSKYVFAQLISFLDRSKFNRIVAKYGGDRAYNNFKQLFRIHLTGAFFIVRAKKNRWQVEQFFKWSKQHLKIKQFWGTTENAVRIQIYCAIIAYCLVAIVQHDMKLDRTVYETLQILSISLTDKTPLADLFDKTNFKNVKERSGLYDGPDLFENFKF